jgi:hypothetical protein
MSRDLARGSTIATISTVAVALVAMVAVKVFFKGPMESHLGLAVWLIPLLVPFAPIWKLTIGERIVVVLAGCLLTLVLGLVLVAAIFGEAL